MSWWKFFAPQTSSPITDKSALSFLSSWPHHRLQFIYFYSSLRPPSPREEQVHACGEKVTSIFQISKFLIKIPAEFSLFNQPTCLYYLFFNTNPITSSLLPPHHHHFFSTPTRRTDSSNKNSIHTFLIWSERDLVSFLTINPDLPC